MSVRIALLVLLFACDTRAADLDDLAVVRDLTSHRSSSYDLTGGNADSLESFEPQSTRVLLDTDGPGCIRHIWMTLAVFPNHKTLARDLVVRMYWEHSAVPSVEVPLGDFFAQGHNRRCLIESAPILVGQSPSALNCYWPMPFYRHARIELYNSGQRSIRRLYFHIDYELGEIPGCQGLFHAAFHRDRNVRGQEERVNLTGKGNYVVLDTHGQGQYVGCALFIDAEQADRWYEGDDMIFIDGDETLTLHGTGTEDYFSNAWGYSGPFSYPYYGAPMLEKRPDGGIYASLYRWHIPDPIRFKKSIRVTFEHLFARGLVNDFSSVAYWYQLRPIESRESLPDNNYPLVRQETAASPDQSPAAGATIELNGTELEPALRASGIAARAITTDLHDGYSQGGYLRIETRGRAIKIPLTVPEPGEYRVEVKPVLHFISDQIKVGLEGSPSTLIPAKPRNPDEKMFEGKVPFFKIGTVRASGTRLTMIMEGNDVIGIDHIRIRRTDSPTDVPATQPDSSSP